jgi:hypothetical protein
MTEPAPETIELETTKLRIAAPLRGSPDCHSRRSGYLRAMTVHLQNAGEAGQLPSDLIDAAAIGEHIGNRRRRRAAPRAIIDRMRPELAGPGAMSPGVEHRHRRLVAEQPRRGLDRPQLQLIEALEPPCGTLHSAGERRAIEMDALAGQNLHLRYSGRYQANFDTITWVTSAVEAMPVCTENLIRVDEAMESPKLAE